MLLVAIGAYDSSNSNLITFYIDENKPRLPHYPSIEIQVNHNESTIWMIVVDEGASTCIISITCWKHLGSPILIPSPTMLQDFDGHTFWPHRIIPSFSIELGGKDCRDRVRTRQRFATL